MYDKSKQLILNSFILYALVLSGKLWKPAVTFNLVLTAVLSTVDYSVSIPTPVIALISAIER